MTPRFFIDRPIFSWVIAIGILLAGSSRCAGFPWSNIRRSRRRR
jgi:multidrug efflux pump